MPRPAFALAAGTLALASLAPAARAEFKLHYPVIDYRELEFEHAGGVSVDNRGEANNAQSYVNEIEYGLLPWWKPGIEGEWGADPGGNLKFEATTFENYFQLAPQGKYWLDPGFFAEYSHAASRTDADSLTFGPLAQKEQEAFGLDFLHTANLLFTKEVGRNRSDETPIALAWQTRLRLDPRFEPGIEYYGQLLPIESRTETGRPQHRLGPVLIGLFNFYQYGKLRYEIGYLFGLNSATEQGTVRWRLEYEKPF